MVPLGAPAPDFALPALDGATVRRDDLADAPALLVAFLSNHCPYVRHIEGKLGEVVSAFPELAVVAICANDTGEQPSDGPEGLRGQVERTGWTFPYLTDATQEVARSYRAACTPDFFLYGPDRTLVYRGALDESSPGNGRPLTGDNLRTAIELTLKGEAVPEPHRPSVGCSVKYRPGNEPE